MYDVYPGNCAWEFSKSVSGCPSMTKSARVAVLIWVNLVNRQTDTHRHVPPTMEQWDEHTKQRKAASINKERNSPIKSLFFSLTVVEYVVFDRRIFSNTLHKHTSPLRTHVESKNLTLTCIFQHLY